MKTITRFKCEICNKEYLDVNEAKQCETRGVEEPMFDVGDIVYKGAGYGWYNGDKRWVINPMVKLKGNPEHGNCFDKCCTMAFYYVITAITQDLHSLRYHLYTKAMSGKQGHRCGYMYLANPYVLKLIHPVPEFIINDSKELIGNEAEYYW